MASSTDYALEPVSQLVLTTKRTKHTKNTIAPGFMFEEALEKGEYSDGLD